MPPEVYEHTLANYAIGFSLLSFGISVGLMIYVNIIASENLLQENKKLIKAIHDRQINDNWHLDDTKLNLKIKRLESFDGFDGKNFFTWNKSFLSGVVSTFFTYFIILVQFKQADPDDYLPKSN